MKRHLIILTAVFAVSFSVGAAEIAALQTEHLVNPLGIDNPHPRFSWHIEDSRPGAVQTAYRIIVASDSLHFADNVIWDSGRIVSNAVLTEYDGPQLKPLCRYWWRVVCEDMDGTPTQSAMVFFETGMMDASNWKGSWISDDKDKGFQPAPRFRKEFSVTKTPVQARAYVAVSGLYTLLLNGAKVGDRVLDPAFTRYDRRVLYSIFDITPYIKEGENAVGIELGNGWYNHQALATWNFDKAPWRARPAFCLEIHVTYSDGSKDIVCSGPDWKTSIDGPCIYNNIYTGEHYDARREQKGWADAGYDDADWNGAILRSCPASVISSQQMVPIKEDPELEAREITQLRPNRWIYDFGLNMAGNVHLNVQGAKGTVVTLKYAERLSTEGRADQSNIDYYYFGNGKNEPFQTDIVTLSGGPDSFTP